MFKNKIPVFEVFSIPISGAKWLKSLCIHKFQLSNSTEGQWESINEGDSPTVLICALTRDKRMILVRMFRFPVEEFCIELPGGQLKENENGEIGVSREFTEETGYVPGKISKLCRCFAYNSKTNKKFEIFLAEDCEERRDFNLDEAEKYSGLEVNLYSIPEIKKRITLGEIIFDPPISHAIMALEGLKLL